MAIDPNIKQKAADIRTKVFGSEVRESLASGLEGMSGDVESIKGRQGNVESQFQNVIDETTGKDVIIAPELIAARNGKSDLKTRLDDEHAQVTEQLEEKASEQDLIVERERINLLTKVANGETEGNTELLDIRVMTNGQTTSTAGQSVRTQFKEKTGYFYEFDNPTGNLINGMYSINHNIYTDVNNAQLKHSVFTDNISLKWNEKIKVTGKATNSDYPLIMFFDGSTLILSEKTSGNFIDEDFYIPEKTTKIVVNSNSLGYPPKIKFISNKIGIEELRNSINNNKIGIEELRNSNNKIDADFERNILHQRLIRNEKKMKTTLKPLDKAYVTFVVDDTNIEVGQMSDLFIERNLPLCLASIPKYINNSVTPSTSGTTVKQVMQNVVLNGGEVLSHNDTVITSNNTYDKDVLYYQFAETKKLLMDNGFNARGIIRSGGAGQETADYKTTLGYCLEFYDYSDAYGFGQGFVQYDKNRATLTSYTVQQFKAVIDDMVNRKVWEVFMLHNFNEVSADNLISMLDYVKNKEGIEVLTYANFYDNFLD